MADQNEDQIVIEDAPVVETQQEEAPEKEVVSTEDGLAKLQKQLDEERSARLEAEERARQAGAKVNRAEAEKADTELSLVATAIDRTREALDTLENNYAEALSNNDHALAARIQRQMIKHTTDLDKLETGKAAMEERAKSPPVREVSDPVEALAVQLTPKSAAWVKSHPEYASGKKYQQMIAAHNWVIAQGAEPESDTYFRKVEEMLGISDAPKVERKEETRPDAEASADAAKVVKTRESPAAAPVSRSGEGTGGSNSRVVRLTAAQREAAKTSGLTEEQYARNLLDLKKEGKLN